MQFGKLPDIGLVDFSLPPTRPGTLDFLKNSKIKTSKPQVFIGATGWGMREWVGKTYPNGTKASNYLREYGKQFNTIEHNTTHYRIPDVQTVIKWYTETPEDFRFCPKIPQVISHSRDLGLGSGKILEFCHHIGALQEKLGPCFMQLPPYFGPEKQKLLERFFNQFPSHIPLAIELRDSRWFESDEALEALAPSMEKKNIGLVITDVAGRRDVLHMRLTTTIALIRFVGNGLDPTDFQRIDDWVDRLQEWFGNGLSEVYFFCHEPDNILAPELSVYLLDKIKGAFDCVVRGPVFYNNGGDQLSLF